MFTSSLFQSAPSPSFRLILPKTPAKKVKGKRNHAGSLSCKSCNRMTYNNRQILIVPAKISNCNRYYLTGLSKNVRQIHELLSLIKISGLPPKS